MDDVSDSDQKDISGLLLPRPEDLAVGKVTGPFCCIANTVASLEGSHRGRWRPLVGVHGICGAKCLPLAPCFLGPAIKKKRNQNNASIGIYSKSHPVKKQKEKSITKNLRRKSNTILKIDPCSYFCRGLIVVVVPTLLLLFLLAVWCAVCSQQILTS